MQSIGSQEIILIFFIGVILLLTFGLWIWSLIHCIRNQRLSDSNRTIGIVLIAILGLIGSFIYLFLPREPEGVSAQPPRNPNLVK